MTCERQTCLSVHRGITKRFLLTPLKDIEFNGVDETVFLRKFVVLIYLLVLVKF